MFPEVCKPNNSSSLGSLQEDSILGDPGLKVISGRPVSLNPSSKEGLALARSWIGDSLKSQSHSECARARNADSQAVASRSPTRLIDVGPSDGSQEPKLILTSESQSSTDFTFTALSHCWGQTQLLRIADHLTKFDLAALDEDQKKLANIQDRKPLTTTSKTIEQRLRQIPIASLPKTFQDAILFTRGLGIRYIWIDSLCIVQDSKLDWEHEASRMADVYKNSYVTIAAEASRDSHAGMFNKRDLAFDPIELPFRSKARNIQSTVYVRQALDDWETCIDGSSSALSSRGWVLQESLLAPRTIRISSQQMFWECRSHSLAESNIAPFIFGKRRPNPWDWSHNKHFVSEDTTELRCEFPGEIIDREILYLQWSSIVHNFSSRKLSFPSDIFPALEGLARDFNARLKDTYIAGMWARDLLRGLLWKVEESKTGDIAREADPRRAPSWSWGSVIGGLVGDASHLVYRVGDYHANIIDADIALHKGKPWAFNDLNNHYGQIASGVLTIRGRWSPCARWPGFEDKYYDQVSIVRDTEGFGTMFRYFDCILDEQFEARHNDGRTLGLLEIATWVQNPNIFPVAYYLILESQGLSPESLFKRVGVVALHKETKDLRAHEDLVRDWEIKEVNII